MQESLELIKDICVSLALSVFGGMLIVLTWMQFKMFLSDAIKDAWKNLTPVGRAVLGVGMVMATLYAQKPNANGLMGVSRMAAPREMQNELPSEPETTETSAGLFPAYTNAVTNVCATGIRPAETSVFLRAHWPQNLYPAPTGVEVYAASVLSTNGWDGNWDRPRSRICEQHDHRAAVFDSSGRMDKFDVLYAWSSCRYG